MNTKWKKVVLIVIILVYLLMAGFAEDLTRFLGLPGESINEYLMLPNVIVMLGIFIYEGLKFLMKGKIQASEEGLARQNVYNKSRWYLYQFMMLALIVIYFLKDTEQFNTAGKALGFAITLMTFIFVVAKLSYYFKPEKK